MQLVPIEDMDFLAKQSSGKINMIISGMTALMNDNENKVEQLESQGWFSRMCKTITGKNKATRAEIQRNHDRINAYMSEAIAELYNRNLIDHEIILSLGTQINELYADHIQLKQMLGAFAMKLNEKIESVDNFHMLTTEIEQGVYSNLPSLVAVCKVMSQYDGRILSDQRKLDILNRALTSQGILNDEQVSLKEYLAQVVNVSINEAGKIYLELGTVRGNFIADILIEVMSDYYFLPDMVRKLSSKPAIISSIINAKKLNESATLSIREIYDEFINTKIEGSNALVAAYILNETDPDKVRRAAEMGIPEAQFSLGVMYRYGGGVERDYEKAIEWYRKSAAQGYASAENNLGFMYEKGFGVEQDYKKAMEWYMKAAEKGQPRAQFHLGNMYMYAKGVEENYSKAAEWYIKAAEQGDPGAQLDLGWLYDTGNGVTQDSVQAVNWYRKSAEQGHPIAMCNLGICYRNGRGVEKNIEKAVEWYRKSAEKGYEEAEKALKELGY